MRYIVKISTIAIVTTTALVGSIIGGMSLYINNGINAEPLNPTFINIAGSTNPNTKNTQSSTGGGKTSQKINAIKQPSKISVSNCTPGTLAPTPIAPQLTSTTSGLIESPIQSTNYQVYGDDINQVRSQIMTCSPVIDGGNRYAASTNYSISWAYSVLTETNGLCSVNNASVGLGISFQYPAWSPSPSSDANITKSWQTFISNLQLHENGHADLNRVYASSLLASIKAINNSDCETINTTINNIARNQISKLDQANESYDEITGHGASQGAVL